MIVVEGINDFLDAVISEARAANKEVLVQSKGFISFSRCNNLAGEVSAALMYLSQADGATIDFDI